jgi:hypothetical protein
LHDLVQSATCPDNHDIYRELVELEIVSSFSFQEGRWLGDIAPHLLSGETLNRLKTAKQQARMREEAEAGIPKHLLYTKGWPRVLPTLSEARLLSDVRRRVSAIMELPVFYTDAEAVQQRYAELMEKNALRGKGQLTALLEPIQQGLWNREVNA